MVAPKGSGTSLRRLFLQGRGVNSSYAVFQDATGRALERTLALGIGVGSGYMFETDFKHEVYSDLTGERGTLMGAPFRVREVSKSLKAYARMVSSADKGAIRVID